MLYKTEVLDVFRNTQIFGLHDPKEESQETTPNRNPGVLQKLSHFQYLAVTGPHQAVSQIQALCRQWLQPETHTKEQMLEQLVLEQFLSALPKAVQTWVRWKQPKNSHEAGTLVANLIQACEEKGIPSKNFKNASCKHVEQEDSTEEAIFDNLPSAGTQCCCCVSKMFPLPTDYKESRELFSRVVIVLSSRVTPYLQGKQVNDYPKVLRTQDWVSLVTSLPSPSGSQFSKPDLISQLEEEESSGMEEDGDAVVFQDWEMSPETKEPSAEHSQPADKLPLGAGAEESAVSDPAGESSDGRSESQQDSGEQPLSPMAPSEPQPLTQERSHSSGSDLTQQPEVPPGEASQEGATPGTCTSPRPAHEAPFLPKDRPDKCGFEEGIFRTQRDPERHKQLAHPCGPKGTHSQEDYYECLRCGRAFIKDVHLFEHLQAHKAAKALPPELPRTKMYSIRYLRKHSYVGERACQCCDCGKAFGRSSHLIQHYRIHAQERPFQCQLCGRCFSRPSYLTQHYQLHSQEGPATNTH
uniref:Zinc finger imprinted 2 n=1 Tax=Loxodonta africana TaxID=9785 RepID=G3U3R8_LOXAF